MLTMLTNGIVHCTKVGDYARELHPSILEILGLVSLRRLLEDF